MATMWRRLAVMVVALAGCAPPLPPPPPPVEYGPANVAAAFFQCPPAGSKVSTSIGETISYLGAEPDDREICLMRYASRPGETVRMLYGSFVAGTQDEPTLRRMMREFLPFAAGKSASATVQNYGAGQQWRITRTWLGEQRLDLPAGSFDTFNVEQVEEGFAGNISRVVMRWHYDRASWLPVRYSARLDRGRGAVLPAWDAATVVVGVP